jgi:oligopeptide transport system ATP-binding protein
MNDALLDVRDLEVSFKVQRGHGFSRSAHSWVHAVDGVDLQVARGEVLGLVGESGCGKSTLARCIVGLHKPKAGEIRFDGHLLSANRTLSERRRMQMVFQDPYSSLNPRLTAGQTIEELLRVHRVVPKGEVPGRVHQLLGLVGLGPWVSNAYPGQLSGGQRQRVSIARALALEPELLLADEPVSALDVSVQANVINLLQDLQRRLKLTMLFIAHNLAVVRHVCDRIAVMYLGRIVEVAESRELFEDPRHPYTQGLLRAIPRLGRGVQAHEDAVQGEPPSPLLIPTGCRFHPRCPLTAAKCKVEDPRLEPGPQRKHAAACHFAWDAVES